MENLEQLKYPIGKFVFKTSVTQDDINEWITILETLPQRLTSLVEELSAEQLETPYRPEGWTIRQVVHHIADSHHNSYTRFKWALTESTPIIKVYEEKEWSKLFDARTAPIQISLNYLTTLHAKLVYLLKGLSATDLQKGYIHPDGNVLVTVEENIAKYAWHSQHHYAHIEGVMKRKGWI